MDIVLLQLPFWGTGCPPLGLATLKSYLAKEGITCKVFDINANAFNLRGKKYHEHWELKNGCNFPYDYQAMTDYYADNRALFLYYMNEIKKLNPLAVGCSCQSSSMILTEMFLQDLRNNLPKFKHILGGSEVAGFMQNADRLIKTNYIDAINFDEGEISLTAYMKNLKKNKSTPVSGMIYKQGKNIIEGGEPVLIKDLDTLPFPDFSDFKLSHYHESNSLPTYASRGCINKCIYCSARSYMKTFRFRTAQRMFDEIKHLKEQYPQLTTLRMCDNISNAKMKELEKLCDLLIESKIGVKWSLENAVIRKEMTTPIYKKLKKAGCTLVGYGMETPSPVLLDKIGKRLSKGVDIARVLREGKKAGLYISVNVMFGLPGETDEDFNYLLKFLKKNKGAFDMVNPSLNFCEFYPGALARENPEKYGIDISKGHLFWESIDKTNTYPIRMKRFELFCKKAKEFKLDNLFNIEELANKHELLFEYYSISKDYDKALSEYEKIPIGRRSSNTKGKPQALFMGKTFNETLIGVSLSTMIESLEQTKTFADVPTKLWKRKLRNIMHKIIGVDKIDNKLSSIYSLVKIVDEKVSCYKQGVE